MSQLKMSLDELLSLPVSVDLTTAGRAFGIGRTKSFELVRQGRFPVKVISVGAKYRVTRSAIFEALGLDPATAVSTDQRSAARR
ncbi:MAG TPA: DNA-binding protein [Streptosporangiaceae bacterium]|nr:DNA-binding protein [Streptosporangiaceae bacterium]